jgi:hypothetical protein
MRSSFHLDCPAPQVQIVATRYPALRFHPVAVALLVGAPPCPPTAALVRGGRRPLVPGPYWTHVSWSGLGVRLISAPQLFKCPHGGVPRPRTLRAARRLPYAMADASCDRRPRLGSARRHP